MCPFWVAANHHGKREERMPDQKTISMVDPFEDDEPQQASPAVDPFEDDDGGSGPPARPATTASASRLLGSLGEAKKVEKGGPATAMPATPQQAPQSSRQAREPTARERMKAQLPPGKRLWDEDEHKRPHGGEESWIPTAHVSELASRGLEVCLGVPRVVGGETREIELWIVPEVDEESERDELSWKDLATIANCLIAFPGAKVSSLKLAGKKSK